MADWQNDTRDDERNEAVHPNEPPAVDLHSGGTASTWVYLAPFIVMFAIVGIALLYWATRDGTPDDRRVEPTAGTSGEVTPGGGDPAPRPDNTREERESRQDSR